VDQRRQLLAGTPYYCMNNPNFCCRDKSKPCNPACVWCEACCLLGPATIVNRQIVQRMRGIQSDCCENMIIMCLAGASEGAAASNSSNNRGCPCSHLICGMCLACYLTQQQIEVDSLTPMQAAPMQVVMQ